MHLFLHSRMYSSCTVVCKYMFILMYSLMYSCTVYVHLIVQYMHTCTVFVHWYGLCTLVQSYVQFYTCTLLYVQLYNKQFYMYNCTVWSCTIVQSHVHLYSLINLIKLVHLFTFSLVHLYSVINLIKLVHFFSCALRVSDNLMR